MRFDLGILDSGEQSLPFGLLVHFGFTWALLMKKPILDLVLHIAYWIFMTLAGHLVCLSYLFYF